ncbi:MAG: hypothetical protein OXG44_10380, partial [Gammaproteobacteria bacterium]|nr:hypothetical protein [Gammaproteobacteria bacterium]
MNKLAAIVCGLAATMYTAVAVGGPEDFPRTVSGKPDFSGSYDIATLTPYTRDPRHGENLYLDPADAASREEGQAKWAEADRAPKDPDRGPPPKGADVGAYEFYWLDPGTTMFKID